MTKRTRLNILPSAYECRTADNCCGEGVSRRHFMAALSGGVAAAMLLNDRPVMAGPYETADFAKLIPPDKKLNPEWVASLFARGEPTVYSKAKGELQHIGMPVGGHCCGTVYLGGDGKLWLWDIFNQNRNGIQPRQVPWNGFGHPHDVDPQNGANYVSPAQVESPFEQGFALRVNGVERPMDARGWKEITFRGNYPIGEINYSDPGCPVTVKLEAYSPFIPLNEDDSGLPVTICEFAVTNSSPTAAAIDMAGFLQNACSLLHAAPGCGGRINEVRHHANATIMAMRFDATLAQSPEARRPDIVVDDFDQANYGQWKTTGTAFGRGPIKRAKMPAYQGDVGGKGPRVVNSHATAPGSTIAQKDSATGTLTSPPFTIKRRFLTFYIGGGSNIKTVGLRLKVNGKVVRQATGNDNNKMRAAHFDVSEFEGKKAVIEIYDHATGPWGNIGISDIVQTDMPLPATVSRKDGDFGTMAMGVLGQAVAKADLAGRSPFAAAASNDGSADPGTMLLGGLVQSITLAPGESKTIIFFTAWHFPNGNIDPTGNYYTRRFSDAAAVISYVAQHYPRLSRDTKLWRDTWYDSSLPWWFLDRVVYNTAVLATSTSHRFGTGMYWGWEGVGCCPGSCTHVYHYSQATARLFPQLERTLRTMMDFGMALDKNGMIGFRGPGTGPAVDGQAGMILCALREHQMSADDSFLKSIWPGVKLAIGWLMRHTDAHTGLINGSQPNTLDAVWYGQIPWISGLYAAALRAGELMATDTADHAFAALCARKFSQTKKSIESELFNGEFFIQKADPAHRHDIGTYQTSFTEQVHGQTWAWQIGLGRVFDRDKTILALQAIYKYNFTTNVGPFRMANPAGRPYALAGDGGLILATNPRNLPKPFGVESAWQAEYFQECMSGFEHQVASNMLAEGLLLEGLAITRAIHDRYSARLRNPFNEIECSDHYSRSMASYGTFISICRYQYHGPKGHIGFDPQLRPDNFKAPFTTASGWGTFTLRKTAAGRKAEFHLRWGTLNLATISLPAGKFAGVSVILNRKQIAANLIHEPDGIRIKLGRQVKLQAGDVLSVLLA